MRVLGRIRQMKGGGSGPVMVTPQARWAHTIGLEVSGGHGTIGWMDFRLAQKGRPGPGGLRGLMQS